MAWCLPMVNLCDAPRSRDESNFLPFDKVPAPCTEESASSAHAASEQTKIQLQDWPHLCSGSQQPDRPLDKCTLKKEKNHISLRAAPHMK